LTFEEQVITGNPSYILDYLERDLKSVEKSGNDVHLEMLKELIYTEKDAISNLEIKISPVVDFGDFKLFTTSRIKSNGERAKRVILQHPRNGSFKTSFKKNLYSDGPLDKEAVNRVAGPISNTLKKTFGFNRDKALEIIREKLAA
jgi:hypothetical protein